MISPHAFPSPPEEPAFYAALTMTGDQENTATPSDSGLFQRLTSGGWVPVGPRILGVSSVSIHPENPQIMLIPCSDGIVRSADGGRSWRKTTGWEVADAREVAFDLAKPDGVYAATLWGPLRSIDGGQSWRRAQDGLDRLYGRTLIVDRACPDRVIVGMEDGLYVSTNAARSWTPLDFPSAPLSRLVQSVQRPERILATTVGQGAWLSEDAGASWRGVDASTSSANLYAATLSPHDAALMAIGGWDVGVRVSVDGGQTWLDRSVGLPNKCIFVLAFDPRHPCRLWASTFEDGTYYTDDLGTSWEDGGLGGAYGADFVFA